MVTLLVKPYSGDAIYNKLECFSTSATVVVAMLLTVLSDYQDGIEAVSGVIALVCLSSAAAVVFCCLKILLKIPRDIKHAEEQKASKITLDVPPTEGEAEDTTTWSNSSPTTWTNPPFGEMVPVSDVENEKVRALQTEVEQLRKEIDVGRRSKGRS